MLDHRVDEPARRGVHAPWRGARAHELGIVGEGVNAGAEASVAFSHPVDDLVRRGRAIDTWEGTRVVPLHRAVTEGVVFVDVLVGADVLDDVVDAPFRAVGEPEPVVVAH